MNLSALLDWRTDHLIEGASRWENAIERSYGLAHQVWRESLSVDWDGQAAETLRTATYADMQTTGAVADQLQAAARVARSGASELCAARSRLRYAVEDARTAGFDVGEDLSLTDRLISRSPGLRTARAAEQQAFAGDIRRLAAELVVLDAHVAGQVTAATAGIGDSFRQHSARSAAPLKDDGGIQTVDRTWALDPPPRIDRGPTGDEIRRVLDKLPVGDRPGVKEVGSAEDLQRLWNWVQRGGVEIPNGYGDRSKGIRYQLPDGTVIGQRWSSESNGMPVLDFNMPDRGGYTKIHINPRGGAPEIPRLGVSPAEPVAPAPPVRAPVAAPPLGAQPGTGDGGIRMPAPPMGGLPPYSPATGPHPIHIPHTLDHKWPLLGEIPEEFEGPRE